MARALLLICALLLGNSAQAATGAEIAEGATQGAFRGIYVCLWPVRIGAESGDPKGLVAGAALTLICLPFGVTIGALAGAANAALPGARAGG